ncbi:MAG TPA: PAS domain-containing protein, partial [Kofleriaceae bacterium]|nr:PAS domain-containing protein [Kofleriaceae bacterium]
MSKSKSSSSSKRASSPKPTSRKTIAPKLVVAAKPQAPAAEDNELHDEANQVKAINRTQAVIHFEMNGTITDANDNFLNAVGYRRDEIVGKHHSMFVDPQEVRTDDYRRFWDKFATGT